MDQNKVLSIDVTVSEKENVAMQATDGDNVTVSPQDVVKVTTDNYEDLQHLPTINGEPLKGEISDQIETLIPNVPDWAMQQQPPKYTSEDVGAVSEYNFSVAVEKLNEDISEANNGIQSNSRSIAELTRADSILDEKKVDKVVGKGLSTNDLTNELVEKINKSEQNIQADWNETNSASDAFIKNKPESMPASDVYEWAKAAQKPSYTAEEVGALPEDTVTITPEQAQQIEDNAEQIVKVKEDIVALDKRVDDIAITQTFSGSSISAEGTSNNPFRGLKLFGKSTQDGTPSPDNPIPVVSAGDNGQIDVSVYGGNLLSTIESFDKTSMNGVDIYIRENGVIETSGNYKSYAQFVCMNAFELPKGQYSFYGRRGYQLRSIDGLQTYAQFIYNEPVVNFELEKNTMLRFRVVIDSSGSLGMARPYITLRGDFPYESYKQSQTLSYPTPNGLPGIPVSSGGNYTDENGQQWVCDEVDFERGTYVKRVNILFANQYINLLYKSSSTNNNLYYINFNAPLPLNNNGIYVESGLSNKFKYNKYVYSESLEGFDITNISEVRFSVRFGFGINKMHTLQEAKEWFLENQVSVMYALKNIEETPLTPEILSAYAALHTNYPTTTVMNDSGIGMECKCEMETKSYIEKNFVLKSELNGMVEQILSQNTSETVYSDEEYGF